MYAGRALPASTCDFGISVINGSAEITPYIGWGGSSSGSIGGEGAISGSTAGEGTDEGSLPPPVEGGCGSWAAFGVSWFLSGIFITWVFFDIRTMEIDLGMDEVVIGACDIYLDVVNSSSGLFSAYFRAQARKAKMSDERESDANRRWPDAG
eukprot:CAMPEP_0113897532 /NCGR_PEP_ID=MMETSP0780_2-20120614/18749_1 /TAXON_ID=652834 /ORGANISM="Palpitomonas bilix" /LENGTH=151 /DNA_ID=CAMNT_0000889041 /DNA_START=553 /DNA_END=1009 /DNA_ORIENTATION=+ /assembly_acc=CAM_ASM_000599